MKHQWHSHPPRRSLPKLNLSRSAPPPFRKPFFECLEQRRLLAAADVAYGLLPLSFEANTGQTDSQVDFLARGDGYGVFLTGGQAVLALRPVGTSDDTESSAERPAVVRLELVGGNSEPAVVGLNELPSKSNYFIGNDPAQWRTDVAHFGRVEYEDVYPDIDLIYYGNQRRLEFDFVVAPGADPGSIVLNFQGADEVSLDADGGLVVEVSGGDIIWQPPVSYQEAAGVRQAVESRYVLEADGSVRFELGAYDPGQPLVIDPILVYSTYLGGTNHEFGNFQTHSGIQVDASGNAYLIGTTLSTDFPTANPIQATSGGSIAGAFGDAFVSKLDPTGTSLVYSTYLGGGDDDVGHDLALDSSGNVYITGYTYSGDFPTANAIEQDASRGVAVKSTNSGGTWSSISSGLPNFTIETFAIDPVTPTTIYAGSSSAGTSRSNAGGAFKSTDGGSTWSAINTGLFPPNPLSIHSLAIDPTSTSTLYAAAGDSFGGVFKTTDAGANWTEVLSTGSSNAVIIDPITSTTIYSITGGSVFKSIDSGVTWGAGVATGAFTLQSLAIDPVTTSTLYAVGDDIYKSIDGGATWGSADSNDSSSVAIDPATPATIYAGTNFVGVLKSIDNGVTWNAVNTGLPSFPAGHPVQALVIDPAAPSTVYAAIESQGIFKTTDGGANWSAVNTGVDNRYVYALELDPTASTTIYAGSKGSKDAFAAKINPAGSALVYSTFVGGGSDDDGFGIDVDPSGNAYLTGGTRSTDFPTTVGAFQTASQRATGFTFANDVFVTKINAAGSAFDYSTYLGGSATNVGEVANDIGVDDSGNAIVTGSAGSSDFPTTAGAFQETHSAGVPGEAFVTKFNAAGSGLVYSTFLGGGLADEGYGIYVDASGNAFVTGSTQSSDFDTTGGAFQTTLGGASDAFVTTFDSAGTIGYSTLLGGTGGEDGFGIVADGTGNAHVTGRTGSTDFPTHDAFQTTRGNFEDVFVTKFNPTGTAVDYSTFLGGDGSDVGMGIAVNSFGSVYVTGSTNSANFPTANPFQAANAGSSDAFVAKIGGRLFRVDSTGDQSDANIGDSVCDIGTGDCTLRAAIQEANALANIEDIPDFIAFDISGAGPHTITPLSELPAITDPVTIDGTTEPDFVAAPVIELNGSSAGVSADGLEVNSGGAGSTIRGLAVNRFGGSGIVIAGGSGNRIEGNRIGTDVGGTLDFGNSKQGIFISDSSNNTIGGSSSDARNLLSGNSQYGVLISGAAATGNVVQGNLLGTDSTGSVALGNALSGVYLLNASSNTIGGTTAGAGNVISGNAKHGVLIKGATSTGNFVRGNLIGLNENGDADLGNARAGVIISGAPSNTVGGTTASAGNVISGNNEHGVWIAGTAATGNRVQGNFVGLNENGDGDFGNTRGGVLINNAPSNTIGGTTAGAGNVISGNDRHGVLIAGGASTGNRLQGNLIGTDSTGNADVGNTLGGVYIAVAPSNTIGGTTAGAGNVISGNANLGVLIKGGAATGNLVQGNLIGLNVSGDADLGNTRSGVVISSAPSNTIGGTTASAGNVLSGNNEHGVWIAGAASTDNLVQGNLIGLNENGDADLGNTRNGVLIKDASSNTIGGTASGAGNVISGNNNHGVLIAGATSILNLVQGNLIGTDIGGTLPSGNALRGVQISDGKINTIGGTSANAGNVIAFNGRIGVGIFGSAAVRNAIQRNSIFSNTQLGIDLLGNGVTANDVNDPDTGPNRLQNFPEMTSAVLSGGDLTITYSVPSNTSNSAYPLTIEFFLADADNEEGKTFLGSDTYESGNATNPKVTPPITVAGVNAGDRIVATATDNNGSTSEFSLNRLITSPLQAAGGPAAFSSSATLSAGELEPIVSAALQRLSAAGANATDLAALASVQFAIADLPGALLGSASSSRITLDTNAAGYGWYIDPTPLDDSEFDSGSGRATLDAQLHMDLLTAVMHELGHVLGLDDVIDDSLAEDIMLATLSAGHRRLP